ncbi:MAG: queuosine salvage family protein [bacterium]|nr:queuosine salvage family protein [bacterium]
MRAVVLESIAPVVGDLRHLRIDGEGIRAFCARHPAAGIRLPDWRHEFVYPWNDERAADFFLLFNCVNFAFWARPGAVKWNISYRGRRLDGAYGLMGALTRAVEEGVPVLDGAFLARLTDGELDGILRGEGELVLRRERAEILREVGRGLVERHGGSFGRLLRAAGGSASRLARLLVEEFPSFRDACGVDGREVKFYKRAQLAPAMIYQRFGGAGPGGFADIGDLTVFADYKVPQALRGLGILRYGEGLAAKVDSRVMLPACGREEVEIRAATIRACELIMEEYGRKGQRMNAVTLDAFLWLLAHDSPPDDRPYHLTETICY